MLSGNAAAGLGAKSLPFLSAVTLVARATPKLLSKFAARVRFIVCTVSYVFVCCPLMCMWLWCWVRSDLIPFRIDAGVQELYPLSAVE